MEAMKKLDPENTKRTLRRLHGESHDGGNIEGADSDQVERIERLWSALEPPSATDPPPDFASRTADVLRSRQHAGSWSVAPVWARGTAAAALAAGLLLGVGVGSRFAPPTATPAAGPTVSPVASEAAASSPADGEMDWVPFDDEVWSEEEWSDAWNHAFDASFGSAGDGS